MSSLIVATLWLRLLTLASTMLRCLFPSIDSFFNLTTTQWGQATHKRLLGSVHKIFGIKRILKKSLRTTTHNNHNNTRRKTTTPNVIVSNDVYTRSARNSNNNSSNGYNANKNSNNSTINNNNRNLGGFQHCGKQRVCNVRKKNWLKLGRFLKNNSCNSCCRPRPLCYSGCPGLCVQNFRSRGCNRTSPCGSRVCSSPCTCKCNCGPCNCGCSNDCLCKPGCLCDCGCKCECDCDCSCCMDGPSCCGESPCCMPRQCFSPPKFLPYCSPSSCPPVIDVSDEDDDFDNEESFECLSCEGGLFPKRMKCMQQSEKSKLHQQISCLVSQQQIILQQQQCLQDQLIRQNDLLENQYKLQKRQSILNCNKTCMLNSERKRGVKFKLMPTNCPPLECDYQSDEPSLPIQNSFHSQNDSQMNLSQFSSHPNCTCPQVICNNFDDDDNGSILEMKFPMESRRIRNINL